ncbi:Orexin receptor type 2 [Amphibalanus amphitrite]|uniref:Orexin receptor type 2 n=1 Tax=Amphibalanus amphitrite TaxID=1232801 RepID=A0A6A4W1V6_AMPAM|nr:Orexin receptor type 2 [Amphibalanus amphitrite]
MAECVTLLPDVVAQYNATVCGGAEQGDEPQFPVYVRVLVTLTCSVILTVGIVGNVLVPLVIWRNRELRNSTNFFLLNLSLADLCVLLLCMPQVLVEVHTRPEVWVLGKTICEYRAAHPGPSPWALGTTF